MKINTKRKRKTDKKKKKSFFTLLIIICAIVFCTSAYMLISYWMEGEKVEKAYDNLRELPDAQQTDKYSGLLPAYEKLHELNKDFVGWLKITDTAVDYPVVQTISDPEYYLARNFAGEKSASGTLFASEISDITTPSDMIIIYGHHMKNGSMFGGLKKYLKRDYLEEHRTLRLDTLTERHEYEVIAVMRTSVSLIATDEGVTSEFPYYEYSNFGDEEDFTKFMDYVQKFDVYDSGYTAEYGDRLILLSTCEYTRKNGRLLLLAKEVSSTDKNDVVTPASAWQK
jgi:sortase B